MEGFYKFDGENWYYAPHFIYAKDYVLEKDLIATQLGFFLALLIKLIIYFFN